MIHSSLLLPETRFCVFLGSPTSQLRLAFYKRGGRQGADGTPHCQRPAAHASRCSGGVLRENGIVTDEPAAQSRRCGQSANYLLSQTRDGLPAIVLRRLPAIGEGDHLGCFANISHAEKSSEREIHDLGKAVRGYGNV